MQFPSIAVFLTFFSLTWAREGYTPYRLVVEDSSGNFDGQALAFSKLDPDKELPPLYSMAPNDPDMIPVEFMTDNTTFAPMYAAPEGSDNLYLIIASLGTMFRDSGYGIIGTPYNRGRMARVSDDGYLIHDAGQIPIWFIGKEKEDYHGYGHLLTVTAAGKPEDKVVGAVEVRIRAEQIEE